VVDREVAGRHEEPQLVLLDRTAFGRRHVDDAIGVIARVKPSRHMTRRQIAPLPVAGTIGALEVAAEPVAALARNHVEAYAARRGVGADAGRLIADLLV